MLVVAGIAQVACATETYTKGNEDANTPNPTFDIDFAIAASALDTHITARADVTPWAPINNTADAAAPIVDQDSFFIDSTPATVR